MNYYIRFIESFATLSTARAISLYWVFFMLKARMRSNSIFSIDLHSIAKNVSTFATKSTYNICEIVIWNWTIDFYRNDAIFLLQFSMTFDLSQTIYNQSTIQQNRTKPKQIKPKTSTKDKMNCRFFQIDTKTIRTKCYIWCVSGILSSFEFFYQVLNLIAN